MAVTGLNRMILLRRIQATEARVDRVTPLHPKSMLQEVENFLAFRTFLSTGPPRTPSSGPSKNLSVNLSWFRFEWIIVRVNRANIPVKTLKCQNLTKTNIFLKLGKLFILLRNGTNLVNSVVIT